MIAKAEAIAIIKISGVGSALSKGSTWTYRQVGNATLQTSLKGDLPKTFKIYGSETFICAQCQLQNGTFLAFLKKDGSFWAGSNWQLSLRAIKEGKVDWFVSPEDRFETKPTSISNVLKELKNAG